jgi:outer membrane protein insertion porin family
MIQRKTVLSIATSLLLCLSTPLFSVDLYEEKRVSQIVIDYEAPGLSTQFDPKPLLSKLKTQVGDKFSQYTFDHDLKALAKEYDQIQPSMQVVDDQLVITIRLAPRPIIHQIVFTGNQRYSSSTLLKELDVKPYTIYNRQDFNKSFNKLKEYYIKHGYFESQLSYVLKPFPNTNEVDIEIEVREGRSGRVKRITFEGFTKAEQSELTDQMYLKKYNFMTSWLTGKGVLRDEMLDQDRMMILTYLQNKGYADARVDVQLLDDPSSGKIIVQITAQRGELYHFGAVQVEGNSLIASDDLIKRSLVQPDGIFSPDKVRDSAQAMKDLYGQKGYIDASVQYEMRLKEDAPVFDVDFTVEEGQPYKIGLIQIFGNHSTKNSVILRESLLVPGETFDARKLKATQQRLEAVGYFKSVNVYAVRSLEETTQNENYRDVYIEVEETSTGNVSLFAGFSTTDDIFGGLDLTERNFHLAGLPKAFTGRLSSLRGGGQYFHARATLGKKQNNVLLSWMNPYVNDTLWRLGVELSTTFSDLTAEVFRSRTYGGSVFANYPLTTYWTGGFRQRLRHTSTTYDPSNPDGSQEAAESIMIQDERNAGEGLLSGLSANLSYDSTDSAQKPHRGWRSYLEGECVGLGGSYHFWKFSYTNSIYIPVTKKGTLKVRGDFRFISLFGNKSHTLKNVPYTERYFLGGEGTVRGYKPFILGPTIVLQTENGMKVTEDPTGGRSSVLLSAEYNYGLFPMVDVFAFFDAGGIAAQEWTLTTLRCSVGAGVRLEINRGTPIMIGYGYPLNKERKGDRQSFFFSMSGQF